MLVPEVYCPTFSYDEYNPEELGQILVVEQLRVARLKATGYTRTVVMGRVRDWEVVRCQPYQMKMMVHEVEDGTLLHPQSARVVCQHLRSVMEEEVLREG